MAVLVLLLSWIAVRMENARTQKAATEVAELTPLTSRLAQIEQGFLDKKDDYAALYEMFMELIVKMLALLHLNNLLELLADAAVPRACFHGVDHVVPEFAA